MSIKMIQEGDKMDQPKTMNDLFQMVLERNQPKLFRTHWEGELQDLSTDHFKKYVMTYAAFFQSKGIKSGDRVAIISEKRLEYLFTFFGIWQIGATVVPICETLTDSETQYITENADVSMMITSENFKERGKALVNQFEESFSHYTFEQIHQAALEKYEQINPSPNQLAALVYTSGSTGTPKGVMLTHANFYFNALYSTFEIDFGPNDLIMSILPYWHSFALTAEIAPIFITGGMIGIPKDRDDFSKNIAQYAPTVVLSVPRIADTIRNGILDGIKKQGGMAEKLFNRAMVCSAKFYTDTEKVSSNPMIKMAHAFYTALIFNKIKKKFGGRLRFFVGGGAPLDKDLQVFFKYIGVPMFQGYGLTESSPVISVNSPRKHLLGSSGKLIRWLLPEGGGDYKFRAEDGSESKEIEGELLVKGVCVMSGYWRNPEKTEDTIKNGWLYTGDVGYMKDDFLFLSGRKSNLVVLRNGEKFHPEPIEENVKNSRLISQAVAIGENKRYAYLLLNVDPAASAGLSNDELHQSLKADIEKYTAHFAKYSRPRDFLVLPEFKIEDNTLTSSLKVRRQVVWKRYFQEINEFLEARE
jgi:long-chain acyl-CoA synthetase